MNYPWHGLTPDPWKLRKAPKSYQIQWLRVWGFRHKPQARRRRRQRLRYRSGDDEEEEVEVEDEDGEIEIIEGRMMPESTEHLPYVLQGAPAAGEKMLEPIEPPTRLGSWKKAIEESREIIETGERPDEEDDGNVKNAGSKTMKVMMQLIAGLCAPWMKL